jgi:adenosylcobinamide hydrolase
MNPEVHQRTERGQSMPFRVWRLPVPQLVVSSAPLGGGLGLRTWVLNAQVERGYDRTDPDRHLTELGTSVGLRGEGVGLMTAVDVRTLHQADDSSVQCWATVGVETPVWAAAPDEVAWRQPPASTTSAVRSPGTINIVVRLPVRLADAALVNAIATVSEAKAQAFATAGLDGSGTPTDATCIWCPPDGPAEPYGGPRSRWGAPLARAVHRAVVAGLET